MPLFNKNNMKILKRMFRKKLINGVLESTFKSLFKSVTGITTNENAIAAVKPYKVYVALLSQGGTDAPVAIVLENTLGGTLVWSYQEVGGYRATLVGAFPDADKIHFSFPTFWGTNSEKIILNSLEYISSDIIKLVSQTTLALVNDEMIKYPIEIRVYS